MKLQMTYPIPAKKDTYKLVLEFVHGDEDDLTEKTIYVHKKHEDKLVELLEAIATCTQYDSESFDTLSKWHYDYDEDAAEDGDIYFEFPNDISNEDEEPAFFHEHTLTFFDENGQEYLVEEILDEE